MGLLEELDPLRAVTANQMLMRQGLLSRTKPPMQMNELTRQGLLDGAALATSPVPVLGDLVGLGADVNRFINEPESRTPANFGLAALGLIPFLPPLMSAGLGKFAQSQGKTLANLPAGPGRNEAGAIVYHGSPHKFDQFDASKIGTGEGAQAYGHGLYFAENPTVAKGYADDLTNMRVQSAQSHLNKYGGNVDEAINASKKEIDRLKSLSLTPETGAAKRDSLISGQEERLAELMAYKNQGSMNKGSLYKVDLPDEAIAKMLDWDKPLSQQSAALGSLLGDVENVGSVAAEKIRNLANQPGVADWAKRDLLLDAAQVEKSKSPQHVAGVLKRIPLEYGVSADSGPFKGAASDFLSFSKGMQAVPNMDTGGGAISYLQARYGEKQASELLRKQGIPGIRYLDGGSRGAGQGTSNYVVFPGNEGLLKILSRE